ncbi:hypothetical protein EXIGLDRAFT_802353 [Exidia glandulosa HHB12029]|uniref:BTB domain-containing protein n=1 Tax=Exidia glandulosa HHB12029 TaxID=1314781 RepID=A0A165E949_EXIGL|nr:hypothetical protein EXIGLDRAFT_802353 [Exidia glandulosa HHB12029]
MSVDRYTVVIRGETFTLYRDQIEFDAPNYFTALFHGDFRESRTQRVELSRSPDLFRVIVEYMSGYTVLPLAPMMVPSTMTPETALANLLNDAEYYQLSGLVRLIRPPPPPEAYRGYNLAPRPTLKFEEITSAAELDVIFDSTDGVGTSVDGHWQPALISLENVKMKFVDNVLRAMLTTSQKDRLVSRISAQLSWNAPFVCDGAAYVTPARASFVPYATARLNGGDIPLRALTRLCQDVVPTPVSWKLPAPAANYETVARALKEAYETEKQNLIVWCRKLVFLIARDDDVSFSDRLSFRIVYADCITRDRLAAQLQDLLS